MLPIARQFCGHCFMWGMWQKVETKSRFVFSDPRIKREKTPGIDRSLHRINRAFGSEDYPLGAKRKSLNWEEVEQGIGIMNDDVSEVQREEAGSEDTRTEITIVLQGLLCRWLFHCLGVSWEYSAHTWPKKSYSVNHTQGRAKLAVRVLSISYTFFKQPPAPHPGTTRSDVCLASWQSMQTAFLAVSKNSRNSREGILVVLMENTHTCTCELKVTTFLLTQDIG